ncbi:MAG TPA: hypothetical protein VIY48_04380 [Candidatus Paceibacterota bacterium]
MSDHDFHMTAEAQCKATFRKLVVEAASILDRGVYAKVRDVLRLAELNALQTDYAQDGNDIKERFWGTVLSTIDSILSDHKNTSQEVRNWFELQDIWG